MNQKIPRIIHQIWMNPKEDGTLTYPCEGLAKRMKRWAEGSKSYGYKYILWNGESMRDFIRKHEPSFFEIYDKFPFWINRCDIFRYFVLHHMGGAYVDADAILIEGGDPGLFFKYKKAFIVATRGTDAISNFLMGSPIGDPFMKTCYLTANTKTKYAMASAGPGHVESVMKRYPDQVIVVYELNTPLRHHSARSWLNDQIGLYTWSGCLLPYFLVLLLFVLLICIAIWWANRKT